MQPRSLAVALAIATPLSLSACAASVGSDASPGAQTVGVVVDPASATLKTGQSTQFSAQVTGTTDALVTWSVDEPSGGTVDANGVYKAPATATGKFHVRAASHAQPEVSGVAEVNVSAPPPTGAVTISPKTISVPASGKVTFTATVTNLSASTVTWKVSETSGCGSVTNGVYTAPPGPATCHVVATSTADTSKSDTATINVTAVPTITLSQTAVTMDACATYQFTATVGGTTDKAVVWSASGGSVSTAGLFTAPSTAGTYTVTATAHASSSVKAQATVTVKDHVISIAVAPSTVTVSTGGTQQFTATVTTSCGVFTASSP